MQRSTNKIGVLAAALAKAQSEIVNPEKSLTATIEPPFPREGKRAFRPPCLCASTSFANALASMKPRRSRAQRSTGTAA
jgi:hypothetical protein